MGKVKGKIMAEIILAILFVSVLPPMTNIAMWTNVASGSSTKWVEGVDVSNKTNNGNPIEWEKVKNAGKKFAYVKVTEGGYIGTPWVDTMFRYNLFYVIAIGLKGGAYHVARPDTTESGIDDPVDEANFFVDTAYVDCTYPKTLPPALDLEENYTRRTSDFLGNWTKYWLQRVENRIHIRPIIYVGGKEVMNRLAPVAKKYGLTSYGLCFLAPSLQP